jgi:hypothetical protein
MPDGRNLPAWDLLDPDTGICQKRRIRKHRTFLKTLPGPGACMDNGLFHLFLYATIILTALTGAGIFYFLADRRKNRTSLPTLGDHDRLAVLDQEIRKHRETLETLCRERDALSARIGRKTHETDSSS